MWEVQCLRKCKKCESYKQKYLQQKQEIKRMEEYIASILQTQKNIVELMEQINQK